MSFIRPSAVESLRLRTANTVRGLFFLACCTLASAHGQIPQAPYQWGPIHIVGGGYVTGVLFHPAQKGLLYARTDIGGAYKWDPTANRWFPITDFIGLDNKNDLGIEGMAIDAKDPALLYLAVGESTQSWAPNGKILRSTDAGKTFTSTSLPFKLGANEDGRAAAQRLTVDPLNSKVLYLGTRHDGLWRSTDSAATWTKLSTFPSIPDNGVGILAVIPVATDGVAPLESTAETASKSIYAAVSGNDAGLFHSFDAGKTWTRVPKQHSGLLITNTALSSNGKLYLTYGNTPGPMGETKGALWRLDLATGKWADITPSIPGYQWPDGTTNPAFGYGGIAVSSSNPDILLASTLNRWDPGDAVFRSTDGGKHWTDIADSHQPRYESLSPWLHHEWPTHGAGTWPTTLGIDPFDPNHVLVGTGETLWATPEANALEQGHPVRWTIDAAGIEETAALVLLSPPTGPHLISGHRDIGGFRHDDLVQSPRAGSFKNPELADTTSIAYSAADPVLMVRVGSSWHGGVLGGVSKDQGITWAPFATQPERTKGAGSIALSADGKTILWAGEEAPVSISHDLGSKWTTVSGMPRNARVLADPVNAAKLYLYSPGEGTVLATSDAGATFQGYAQGLPKAQDYEQPGIYATPGREGDLWIGSEQGLFHSSGSAKPFERVTSVEMIHALGFGVAAQGHTNPTLFIFGRVQKLAAMFASLDWGKSWIRIDDDTHRFGDIRAITGDPRLFGRVYAGTEGRGILAGDPVRSHP